MIKLPIKKIKQFIFKKGPVDPYLDYLYHAYPSNHAYKLSGQQLKPFYQLRQRYKKILPLLPRPLTSFVDIGCSKGFFVFAANQQLNCQRNLGIDVHVPDIQLCHWVKQQLLGPPVTFAEMRLHELAERIDEQGGPFQTVLLLNTYQYLYFGSRDHRDCYLDHDTIFKMLRTICHGRVIFSNRLDWEDCQQQLKPLATSIEQNRYTRRDILTTAAKYFSITEIGKIGRYPLWVFDVEK